MSTLRGLRAGFNPGSVDTLGLMPTHEVLNQVPPLEGFDGSEHPLYAETLERLGAMDALDEVREVGVAAGSADALRLGDRAERHAPLLHTHDRFGYRVDRVEYDPAYHELMAKAIGFGLAAAPWAQTRPHAHALRALKYTLWYGTDPGHCCPVTMTYASIPALRRDPGLAARWEPSLTSTEYDPAVAPPSAKRGLTAGMSMTEKQGGSDVRTNSTTAWSRSDGTYELTGHKWFTSAPMSDLFFTLAQAPGGLTCFVVPKVLPDGTLNGIRLQRLKDKLGDRSNASSEIELERALGWRLGDEGRGVRAIIAMVNSTRLDCTLATASLMRMGALQAAHHARHRRAFGARLLDHPLMRNVLADLAVEAEASLTTAFFLADLTDRAAAGSAESGLLLRLALAVSKYHICKRGPQHAAEAMECLGGNGYIEDSRLPRLYREAPLLSIWEGSGNVAALDALRAMRSEPETLRVFFDELDAVRGADARLDAFVAGLRRHLGEEDSLELRGRTVAGDLAAALQASLLVRFGHPAVAAAFTASRLDHRGSAYGTLPAGLDLAPILERSLGA